MAQIKDKKPNHWTELQWAYYQMVNASDVELLLPGYDDPLTGHHAMAVIAGKEPKSLSNAANPDYAGAKLGVDELVAIEKAFDLYGPLHAHAAMLDHVVFKLPDPGMPHGNDELFNKLTIWQADMGTTFAELRAATDPDGDKGSDISKAEAQRIRAAGYIHMTRFIELLAELDTIAV